MGTVESNARSLSDAGIEIDPGSTKDRGEGYCQVYATARVPGHVSQPRPVRRPARTTRRTR